MPSLPGVFLTAFSMQPYLVVALPAAHPAVAGMVPTLRFFPTLILLESKPQCHFRRVLSCTPVRAYTLQCLCAGTAVLVLCGQL